MSKETGGPKPVAVVQEGAINDYAITALNAAGYIVVFTHDVDAVKLTDKTLRDYFAANAMAAIINASPDFSMIAEGREDEAIAANAYAVADAMLAERAK